MKNDSVFDKGGYTYPGAFMPLLNEQEVQSSISDAHISEGELPPVNVIELADSFKVRVAIPGVMRQNFLVYAVGNNLFVCVINKEPELHDGESFQLHEFNYENFNRRVKLPEVADSTFSIAEYKSGILDIYVPKSKQPPKKTFTNIVVY